MLWTCMMLYFSSVFLFFSWICTAHAQFKGIQGGSIKMPCYDTEITGQYTNLFVTVFFTPASGGAERKVCDYKVSTKQVDWHDDAYKNRISFSSAGELVLSQVKLSDEGKYSCQPFEFGLNVDKTFSDLVVYVMPKIEVRKVNDPLVANSGKTMEAAQCSASNGKPAALIQWKTDRNLLFNQTKSSVTEQKDMTTVRSSLFVVPTKFYNGQSFFCEIKHPAFSIDNVTIILLNITYPPDDPAIIVADDRKSLTCISHGNPPPVITWRLPAGSPSATYKGDKVTIIDPTDPARNNDTYTCIASNGVMPDKSSSITTGTAVTIVHFTNQSNVGAIVGGVIGGLIFLAIIVALVYFFVIRPSQEKDPGPYHYQGSAPYEDTSSRPIIEHANESLHKNRPPSPGAPPPEDRPDHDEAVSSDSGSDTDEGNHDVDVEVAPAPIYSEMDRSDNAEIGGITSRASVNFQARRKRPSVSPAHRQSRSEAHMSRKESPAAKPRQHARYDTPPGDNYDGNYSDDQPLTYQGYPEDGYDDGYNQPQYVGYPSHRQPPQRMDSLPQREPKYTEIDHSNYAPSDRRPKYEEPIEYAQIRHGYTHVV